MKNNCCKKGFTLIELLVVVLIIGILAAIAMPQYKKAVWKARASELQTLTKSLVTAQQLYYMQTNTRPESFDVLDIGFSCSPSPELVAAMGAHDGCVKDNKYGLFLTADVVGAMFIDGPYAYAGFTARTKDATDVNMQGGGRLYCFEGAENLGFCDKLFKGTLGGSWNGFNVFSLP